MPNNFAYLVLLAWPALALMLFSQLSFIRAFIWSIIGAYLFLPPSTGFNLPMVPTFDKMSIPALSTYLICVFLMGRRVPIMPVSLMGRLLFLTFIFVPILTVFTNGEPILRGTSVLPGMRLYDAASVMAAQAIVVLPFLMARRFLGTEGAQRELMKAYLVAGLLYSIPMLFEVRMSPQLNTWIYGFFQHSFGQMMRDGGFRPIVFLQHGIWVAFFSMTTIIAALALWRAAPRAVRPRYAFYSAYLFVVLVLCKTLGPLVYVFLLAPLVCFLSQKRQIQTAAVLALLAVSYPVLRTADLVPVTDILRIAEGVNPERAQSLGFRFENEAILLEHANAKSLLGWGTWGRNLEINPQIGGTAIPDGKWVITVGTFGRIGYVAEFGLLSLPIFLVLWETRRRRNCELSPFVGPVSLILAINMIDLLPNATLTPLTWMMAGALLGYAERLRSQRMGADPLHGLGIGAESHDWKPV